MASFMEGSTAAVTKIRREIDIGHAPGLQLRAYSCQAWRPSPGRSVGPIGEFVRLSVLAGPRGAQCVGDEDKQWKVKPSRVSLHVVDDNP